jgi:hypothetical protein
MCCERNIDETMTVENRLKIAALGILGRLNPLFKSRDAHVLFALMVLCRIYVSIGGWEFNDSLMLKLSSLNSTPLFGLNLTEEYANSFVEKGLEDLFFLFEKDMSSDHKRIHYEGGRLVVSLIETCNFFSSHFSLKFSFIFSCFLKSKFIN